MVSPWSGTPGHRGSEDGTWPAPGCTWLYLAYSLVGSSFSL